MSVPTSPQLEVDAAAGSHDWVAKKAEDHMYTFLGEVS